MQAKPPTSVAFEHPGKVGGISLSPDASLVATSCIDSTIRVWDARTGELRASFTRGGLLYGAVMFLPDGHTVAGRERDGTVRFWDVSAESTVNLRGHYGMLNQAFFAEKAELIVSTGWDGWKGYTGCIRFWDAQTGDEVAAIGEPGELVYRLRVSPDGSHVAACITWTESPWTPKEKVKHTRVELINLVTGARLRVGEERVLHPSRESSVPVAFDPTSRMLAVRDAGRLDILDTGTGKKLRSRADILAENDWGDLMWSPDGRVLANARIISSANSGKDTQVWEVIEASTLASLREFEVGMPWSWTFTPDGTGLCFGYPYGTVRRFNVASGKADMTLKAHELGIRALAFNPDGTRLATAGGHDGDIVVWDTTRASFDRVAKFHEPGYVNDVRWDASGERLLGACDRTIRVWDPTPLGERIAAREARAAALAQVEPIVARLILETKDPDEMVKRLNADTTLSPLQRRVALHLTLAHGLRQP